VLVLLDGWLPLECRPGQGLLPADSLLGLSFLGSDHFGVSQHLLAIEGIAVEHFSLGLLDVDSKYSLEVFPRDVVLLAEDGVRRDEPVKISFIQVLLQIQSLQAVVLEIINRTGVGPSRENAEHEGDLQLDVGQLTSDPHDHVFLPLQQVSSLYFLLELRVLAQVTDGYSSIQATDDSALSEDIELSVDLSSLREELKGNLDETDLVFIADFGSVVIDELHLQVLSEEVLLGVLIFVERELLAVAEGGVDSGSKLGSHVGVEEGVREEGS